MATAEPQRELVVAAAIPVGRAGAQALDEHRLRHREQNPMIEWELGLLL
jgi:hypothetical protein